MGGIIVKCKRKYCGELCQNKMGNLKYKDGEDKPWWKKSSKGEFTVKSVWEIFR